MAVIGIVLSFVATVIAVLSYGRAMTSQLPGVEFLADDPDPASHYYRIRIDNRGPRFLYLNHIRVREPGPNSASLVRSWYMVSLGGGMHRHVREDLEGGPHVAGRDQLRALYLCIPPNSIRDVHLEIVPTGKARGRQPRFDVSIRLHWSRSLPIPERFFVQGCIVVKARDLPALKRAAIDTGRLTDAPSTG